MDWDYVDLDREIFERELDAFVPLKIFDSHAHLYQKAHFKDPLDPLLESGADTVGLEEYKARIAEIAPGRSISGLFFGFPSASLDIAAANEFVSSEAKKDFQSRGQMVVHPGMDPEFVRETVQRLGLVGLKVYHVWSAERPTFESAIPSYLSEEHLRVAHEERLAITLHIVRSRALADPVNQEVIRTYAKKYSDARFILAHAARGFNEHHTAGGVFSLRGLRNVWCDTSAITESGALEAVIATLGPDRLLYGSDFPVTHLRGRCVSIGDSFLWLTPNNANFRTSYGEVRPILVGIESLRALKLACRHMRLSDGEVEAIFYSNGAALFGIS